MKIVSSILPSADLQEQVRQLFPEDQFLFNKGIKGDFYNEFLEAEIFITYGEDLTAQDIEKAENLQWISVMSAGVEKLPFEAIQARNILVTNARGIHQIPMAEYTLGIMLRHAKRFDRFLFEQKVSNWNRRIETEELYGATVLILGAGAIGGEIAKRCQLFGMHTIGVNTTGRNAENFDEMYSMDRWEQPLQQADYIVSVLPSLESTKHLLQKKHFKLMKQSAVFINIGRGSLVEIDVLINALQEQEIAHAYLDVLEEEPLRKENPLWTMENVTITPHISGKSKRYLPRAFDIFSHNLHIFKGVPGEMKNVIQLDRRY
ncbi:phosphoglycerate dehydrogenase-like enzyme [Bacillus oleivorans]|uniref:Phosphoglycerate dehydrogenase-like enzyme n=1 Tax=Bacillus oleivorans TaxID=1448271 RepID=A0A285CS17_9BACI|nr:D-2-hydroxyacid dehydrogenase [Bacillus oleivorans]SNX70284.1 phosphoglycerate dehydrogenase-like enzyme [Bacillus oleivorans]